MPLKDDLLRRGYSPENLAPPFTSATIADFFTSQNSQGFLRQSNSPLRAATYSASKRGLSRRTFSVVHPITGHDTADFVSTHWSKFTKFFERSELSCSVPGQVKGEPHSRALVIGSHRNLEERLIRRLADYRFIARTDIARFYHSIYTHSVPWAYHGKARAKLDRNADSTNLFFNKADAIIRQGQDGQTVGIPVGPDTSRVFAELIATAIDVEFKHRIENIDCRALRYVDDVWLGARSHADAETALSRYREAIREFELDINEAKTNIFAEEFTFVSSWPFEIHSRLDYAAQTNEKRASERLRSALEHCFSMAVRRNDDGILKYAIRYIDKHLTADEHWGVVEPFLKRAAVHFGHTIDFIARILVWRKLTNRDLDLEVWQIILEAIVDKHGRLGNDSEVCWAIYVQQILRIKASETTVRHIIQNCGPLPLVALGNSAIEGLVDKEAFGLMSSRLDTESDDGKFWPLFLEWNAKRWPEQAKVGLGNQTIRQLIDFGASIYDPDIPPVVFRKLSKEKFSEAECAIEQSGIAYEEVAEGEGGLRDDSEEL